MQSLHILISFNMLQIDITDGSFNEKISKI